MPAREILVLGDARLRQKAKKIRSFDGQLKALVDDMLDTLHTANGLGLAAPQIGVPLRLVVIEMPAETDETREIVKPQRTYILCNPEIVKATGEEEMPEACLSVPGYMGRVVRATDVLIKAQDLKGRRVRYRGHDLLAQAFQHELDHLDGILYVDRIRSAEDLWQVEPEGEPDAEAMAEVR